MKRKFTYAFFAFIILSFSSFAQITVEDDNNIESKTQGFFVKNGAQKIDALECYDFKNLILAFDLKPEYFTYDEIFITLTITNNQRNAMGVVIDEQFFLKINKDIFNIQFAGKDYAYFKIFASDDLKEKSEFEYRYSSVIYSLTRSKLQYTTNKKALTDSKMIAEISFGRITGFRTVSETLSDGRVVSNNVNTWEWKPEIEFSIDLKNRIFINPVKAFSEGVPEEPLITGKCYE